MLTRREILKSLGVAGGLAVFGGSYRAWDRGVVGTRLDPAFAPWDNLPNMAGAGPTGFIQAAILAANPHNTQPWLFRIAPDHISLMADLGRNLGPFDPYRREMYLGLGCALENLALAASQAGQYANIELVAGHLGLDHGTGTAAVAQISFQASSGDPDPLAAFMARRHTHRGAYDPGRPVPAELVSLWQSMVADAGGELVLFTRQSPARSAIDTAIVDATAQIIADPGMVMASEAWFRAAGDQLLARRDGLTLDAQALSPGLLAIAKMLPALSADTNSAYWLQATRDVHIATAPLMGFVRVDDPLDIATCLKVGRAWSRIHLSGVQAGIALHPINQIPECIDRERELTRPPATLDKFNALCGAGGVPTFGFRAGYGVGPAGRAPRRPIDQVVMRNA